MAESHLPESRDVVRTFAAEAQRYCAFIDQASTLAMPVRMAVARTRLLALYQAATALAVVEPPDGIDPPPSVDPLTWVGFEDFEHYWEIFDPYAQIFDDTNEVEPVSGSLSDDMLDVYRDVQRGLALWAATDERSRTAATWEWRFGFDSHWGDHAIDALRALHRACARTSGRLSAVP